VADLSPHPILQLYPLPVREHPLPGTYLAHDVRQVTAARARPFVYANFVTSLDGRIAVADARGGGLIVPKTTANPRDWRLFQELAVQADVVISSGRYLRDYAAGKAQEILRVYDDPQFADLRDWRRARNLPAQPAIAVISGSLDFPIPAPLTAGGRQIVVFTTAQADPRRVEDLAAQGVPVVEAGRDTVTGDQLVHAMADRGYHTIYSAAGPQVLHLLLAGGVLDRLYLTLAQRLLGGAPFASILEGPRLDPPVGLRLHSVHFDPAGVDGLGQIFLSYDRA
jgi:riboflavin biosynthesis pyrimidine reductase